MRKLFIVGLVVAGLSLYSCSNSSSDNAVSYEKGFISNNDRPQKTLDGKIITEADKAAALTAEKTANEAKESGNAIDTKAPSDSKGVGPIKEADIPETVDAALASKGKNLFETYCTSCHMTTDQRLVGPGLKGITEIRTPEWILNMILNPMKMTSQDPVAKQLKEELSGVQMTNMGLSKDQAKQVLAYLRQNDQS